MNDSLQRPSTAGRLLRYTWVVGVAVLVISVTGTAWILHSPAADKAGKPGNEQDGQKVICFALVDVEGGMRQLYPMLAQPNRVKEVKVKENQSVAAGAVLLEMDDMLASTNLERAAADLKAAKLQMDKAQQLVKKHEYDVDAQKLVIAEKQNALDAANSTLERAKKMREKLLTGNEDVDLYTKLAKSAENALKAEELKLKGLELDDPQLDITRAEQAVKEKQAVREQADYALKQCKLTAPVEGAIVRLNVSAGDLLGPQARQPAILFCPNTPRILRAEIEQEFAARRIIYPGDSATIQDNDAPAATWRGKVLRLSDVYNSRRTVVQDLPFQLNDVRTRECVIEVEPNPDLPPLSINQRMRVTLGGQ
jgi:multidrug resistance efflux pump